MSLTELSARADKADQEIDQLKDLFSKISSATTVQKSAAVGSEKELLQLQEENRLLKEKLKSFENGGKVLMFILLISRCGQTSKKFRLLARVRTLGT